MKYTTHHLSLPIAIILAVVTVSTIGGCSNKRSQDREDYSSLIAVELTKFKPNVQPDGSFRKFKRSECPPPPNGCGGTGILKSGDGLSTMPCFLCEPDSKEIKANTQSNDDKITTKLDTTNSTETTKIKDEIKNKLSELEKIKESIKQSVKQAQQKLSKQNKLNMQDNGVSSNYCCSPDCKCENCKCELTNEKCCANCTCSKEVEPTKIKHSCCSHCDCENCNCKYPGECLVRANGDLPVRRYDWNRQEWITYRKDSEPLYQKPSKPNQVGGQKTQLSRPPAPNGYSYECDSNGCRLVPQQQQQQQQDWGGRFRFRSFGGGFGGGGGGS